MGNLDNKEKEFSQMLAEVTRTAREQMGVISKEQVEEAFKSLELTQQQYALDFQQHRRSPSFSSLLTVCRSGGEIMRRASPKKHTEKNLHFLYRKLALCGIILLCIGIK